MAAKPVVGEKQRELERRAADIRARVAAGSLPPEDATGGFDDWILDLDGYRVLMHPPSGEWLWYDRVHDTWERTGVGTDDATFKVIDGRLAADRTGFAPTPLPSAPPSVPPKRRAKRRPLRATWRMLSRISLVLGLVSTAFGIYGLATKDDTTASVDLAPVAPASTCTGEGWTVAVPEGWSDSTGLCTTFAPSDPAAITISGTVIHVGPTGESFEDRRAALADADVLLEEDTTVAGLRAVRVGYRPPDGGTSVVFEYLVDHAGQVFVLATTPVLGTDAEVVVPALDALVASLRF